LSDDDTNSNSSNESQEDIETTAEDEQYWLFLKNQLIVAEDLNDNGFESFIQKEGPNRIMNLILAKWINVVWKDFWSDDYEGWIRCVEQDEHMKCAIYF
jgi:hypothetical protein